MRALVDQGIVTSFQLGFAQGNRIEVEVEANAGFQRSSLEVEIRGAMARALQVASLSIGLRSPSSTGEPAPTLHPVATQLGIEELRSITQADEDDEAACGWLVEQQDEPEGSGEASIFSLEESE